MISRESLAFRGGLCKSSMGEHEACQGEGITCGEVRSFLWRSGELLGKSGELWTTSGLLVESPQPEKFPRNTIRDEKISGFEKGLAGGGWR